MNRSKIAHISKIMMATLLRHLVSLLPDFVSILLGRLGCSAIIKRSERISYRARLYRTQYHINVRSDFAVERLATSLTIDGNDPYLAIKKLHLRGRTAIDIGANAGTISIGLVECGCKRVYSFEPGPLYSRLAENVKLNNLSDVICLNRLGLSDKREKLRWAEDKSNPGNAHLIEDEGQLDFNKISTKFNPSEFEEVQVVKLDEFIEQEKINSVDFIKIDVEGMEHRVVLGGRNTIKRDLPIVVAETHRVASDMMMYDCITPIFDLFYGLGYESYSMEKDGCLTKFIYPNFSGDTFFVHPSRKEMVEVG